MALSKTSKPSRSSSMSCEEQARSSTIVAATKQARRHLSLSRRAQQFLYSSSHIHTSITTHDSLTTTIPKLSQPPFSINTIMKALRARSTRVSAPSRRACPRLGANHHSPLVATSVRAKTASPTPPFKSFASVAQLPLSRRVIIFFISVT